MKSKRKISVFLTLALLVCVVAFRVPGTINAVAADPMTDNYASQLGLSISCGDHGTYRIDRYWTGQRYKYNLTFEAEDNYICSYNYMPQCTFDDITVKGCPTSMQFLISNMAIYQMSASASAFAATEFYVTFKKHDGTQASQEKKKGGTTFKTPTEYTIRTGPRRVNIDGKDVRAYIDTTYTVKQWKGDNGSYPGGGKEITVTGNLIFTADKYDVKSTDYVPVK